MSKKTDGTVVADGETATRHRRNVALEGIDWDAVQRDLGRMLQNCAIAVAMGDDKRAAAMLPKLKELCKLAQ